MTIYASFLKVKFTSVKRHKRITNTQKTTISRCKTDPDETQSAKIKDVRKDDREMQNKQRHKKKEKDHKEMQNYKEMGKQLTSLESSSLHESLLHEKDKKIKETNKPPIFKKPLNPAIS